MKRIIKSFCMALLLSPMAILPGMALGADDEVVSESAEQTTEGDADVYSKEWSVKGKDGKNKKFKKIMKMRGKRRGMMGRFHKIWKKLDLTEKQRDQLFELQQEHKRQVFENEMAHERAHFEFHKSLAKEKLNDGELQGAADKIGESAKNRAEAMITFVKKVRDILTPEQAKKLHEMMGKMGPGFDGPPPPPPHH